MANFEIERVKASLSDTKDQLFDYLVDSYKKDSEGAECAAKKTFKYLGDVVDLIIKRQGFKIQFAEGGATLWHAKVLSYLSSWVELEYKYSLLLATALEDLEELN